MENMSKYNKFDEFEFVVLNKTTKKKLKLKGNIGSFYMECANQMVIG